MPFTLAHPAAAVPLRVPLGRQGVLAALVAGSLAPDFVYYLPLGIARSQSHGLAGLLWFCLPAGMIAFGLFYACLRPAAVFVLPAAVRRRLPLPPARLGFSGRSIGVIVLSILAGAVTHVAWDSFTHSDGFFVGLLPPLKHELGVVAGYPVFVFKVLQHGSNLIGLALLALWARRWLQETPTRADARQSEPPAEGLRTAVRIVLVFTTVAIGCLAGMAKVKAGTGAPGFQQFVVHGAIGATAAFTSVLLLVGIGCRLRRVGTR